MDVGGVRPMAGGVERYLSRRRSEVEEALERVLPAEGLEPAPLVSAMRYSVFAGGKRLRPILFLAALEAFAVDAEPSTRDELVEVASALELFHTYSLIHDDLPCMDDDTLRRGKPTCHVAHGEAMALLAGDALQTLGFEVLASRPRGGAWAGRRAEAVAVAAQALGVGGMAGGQALDLAETGGDDHGPQAAGRLRAMHAWKTGALLRASVELGALHAGADSRARSGAAEFGAKLGLLFQIADDVLDAVADAERLGKTAGKDARQKKLTYPAVFGLEGAERELQRALEDATDAARGLPGDTSVLVALATFAGRRDR